MATFPHAAPTVRRADPAGPPLVWKFGGSSVADHVRLRAVAERMVAAQREGHRVVAVLSAMGTSTDELLALAYAMSPRPPLRELDALLSTGESISCALAAMAVAELGAHAVSLSGSQAGVITDDQHGNARLQAVRPERITEALDTGAIVLVTGFQGISGRGDLTTLGRGGSDASAVAIAAALGAGECEIFTDVPAVFTADPRVVPHARRLSSLRPEEMLEMAEAGASVLAPRAVELAMAHGVDIHLRSSFTAEEGTWIRREGASFEGTDVAGIAHRRHEGLHSVKGVPAAAVAAALGARGVVAGVIVPDGDALRFSAPGVDAAEVVAALATIDAGVDVDDELGTVSVISIGIGRNPAVVAATLAALEGDGIVPRLVTTTPGRVCVHLPSAEIDDAVRLLHTTFVPAGIDECISELRPTRSRLATVTVPATRPRKTS